MNNFSERILSQSSTSACNVSPKGKACVRDKHKFIEFSAEKPSYIPCGTWYRCTKCGIERLVDSS